MRNARQATRVRALKQHHTLISPSVLKGQYESYLTMGLHQELRLLLKTYIKAYFKNRFIN